MHHIPQHACIHECIPVYMTNERIFMFKQQIYLTVSLQIIIYFAAICKYTQRVWAYWYNHMKLLDYLIKLLMVHPYTLLIPTVNWSNLKEWFCPIKVEFLNWAFIDWNLLVDSFLLIWNESLLCVTFCTDLTNPIWSHYSMKFNESYNYRYVHGNTSCLLSKNASSANKKKK